MTREEEIKQAAYAQHCNSESICFTLLCNSFKQGAEWADSHPINVWHNAIEEPVRERVFLAEFGVSIYGFQTFFIFGNDTKFNWSEWAEEVRLSRWAYISDLLPKE